MSINNNSKRKSKCSKNFYYGYSNWVKYKLVEIEFLSHLWIGIYQGKSNDQIFMSS